MKKKILYITYDSIEDSISKSQVLPLLERLSKSYDVYLISFEKNIINKKISFIKKFEQVKYGKNKFSKFNSILFCFFKVFFLVKKHNIQIIHCRSYIPSIIAYIIKKITKIKYIFDIRGLWFNEKLDAKLISFFFFKILKKFEKRLYNNSDSIITLSHKSIKFIKTEFKINQKKITYVSCFTDIKKFSNSSTNIKNKLVFGYIGNVKLSYNFNKVLNFFEKFDTINKNWKLIFANNHLSEKERKEIFSNFSLKHKIIFQKSNFDSINKIYKRMNIGIYFLRKDFSKIASCPTKLGEMLSSGIPVITNSGIGDIKTYLNSKRKSGFLIDNINSNNLAKINLYINNSKKYLKLKYNAKYIAMKYFDINKNIQIYKDVYKKLI